MTPEREVLLGELLAELAEDPRGFIPEEAWVAVQKAFALSYLELCLIRRNSVTKRVEILLTHRTDKDWNGWHVPGGLWRTRHNLSTGIASLAKSEFGEGVQITLLDKGGWEKWMDHPFGYPISHITICSAEGVIETSTRKWFENVPEGMIDDYGHHAEFIRTVIAQAEKKSLI